MEQFVFGIDLGGTTVKLGMFRKDGTLLSKWEIPTRTQNGGEYILPDIAAAIKAKLEECSVSADQIVGAGLGVPGAVIADRYVKPCVNLNGWGGEVADELAKLCSFPVKVVNDANAAALGEMWLGGGKGCDNVVFVTLGTGVGGGVIVDGKLLGGVHGSGGEIGHMKMNADETEVCGCGKRGCLEQYASATGIVRVANSLLAAGEEASALRELEKVTAKDVFDYAKKGDKLALKVVDIFGEYLGRALANVSCVCDPEVYVIGGGVSAAGQIIIDHVKAAFVKHAFPATEETRFELATLGNDAGICGCARLMCE
ncbi:MAG: ROK family glucokinase [Oscillospiraceae bacterium]|nr:ROK family glucokinase [Oscillospiraceae bacterium]